MAVLLAFFIQSLQASRYLLGCYISASVASSYPYYVHLIIASVVIIGNMGLTNTNLGLEYEKLFSELVDSLILKP